ncbi:MAG: hypothetical protein HKK66_01615 [Chlorobiaceae bacterium]|nr:hypothetical protein [Chlorobiaceae bacterium]
MKLTITLPDILPDEISQVINKVKAVFTQEGIAVELKPETLSDDSWDNLNIDEIAVDTGRIDFAENYDHYLYGIAK